MKKPTRLGGTVMPKPSEVPTYLLFLGDYNRFGGATAIGLNRVDAINPAFGDRSKAVT
jgi:hypothetical protein